jgi:crossover junction endodeoxyribonuclease RuvC
MILSIDPGLNGGIAVVDGPMLRQVTSMPTMSWGQQKTIVDSYQLNMLINNYRVDYGVTACVVERASARPNQGVTSMFTFGMAYGAVVALMQAHSLSLHLVTPHVWKKQLHLGSDKNESRQKAIEMWPDHEPMFKRKKDDGRAEAALIGYWYEEVFDGNIE